MNSSSAEPLSTNKACDACRKKHVKCGQKWPCQRCQELKLVCNKIKRKSFRFPGKRTEHENLAFPRDQTWLNTNGELSYVHTFDDPSKDTDESDKLLSHTSQDDTATNCETENATESEDIIDVTDTYSAVSQYVDHGSSNEGSPWTDAHVSHAGSRSQHNFPSPRTSAHSAPALTGSSQSDRDPACTSSISTLPIANLDQVVLPTTNTDQAYLDIQEASLMRHFVDKLASWFDTTDRDRHFTVVAPHRAMFCPVLRYAIFTASAGHVTRVSRRNKFSGHFQVDGIDLPDLDEQTAIQYHNLCIGMLINISNDSDLVYNGDALAAATILRYYEQIDTSFTGEDPETYMGVVHAVINSQQNESFYSLSSIVGPVRDNDYNVSPATSMRHSACLIALRQEIWSVMVRRRPVRIPLCPNNDYSVFGPADDFVWTNRILVFTGDVLKFCFGPNGGPSLASDKQRRETYNYLCEVEKAWNSRLPPSFKPVYFKPPEPLLGHYFPEIWHMSPCQIYGIQHLELSRILLAVFNPDIPRLGIGTMAQQRAREQTTRTLLLRICGLATSNPSCGTGLVTAAVACSMCAEYLTDAGEQAAVVTLLEKLQANYAWPTETVILALREVWTGST